MSALEPFLLLAKSARGKAASSVIAKATEAPGVFVFGELLDAAGVKEVRYGESIDARVSQAGAGAWGRGADTLQACRQSLSCPRRAGWVPGRGVPA